MNNRTTNIHLKITDFFKKNSELNILLANNTGNEINIDYKKYKCLRSLYHQYKEIINLDYWFWCIDQCQNSDLSISKWCKQHDISRSSYYYWQHKLSKLQHDLCPNITLIISED